MSRTASFIVGNENLKFRSSHITEYTRCPSNTIEALSGPNMVRTTKLGTGKNAGLLSDLANASENCLFVIIYKIEIPY